MLSFVALEQLQKLYTAKMKEKRFDVCKFYFVATVLCTCTSIVSSYDYNDENK